MKRVDPPVPEVKLRRWWCNCRSVWCWLDQLFSCRWKYVCDKHDQKMVIPGFDERVERYAAEHEDEIVCLLLDEEEPEPVEWTDPLDPHGDGTLRPGDPVFDALMRGEAVVGNYDEEKGWEIETHRVKDPDPSRSPIERNGGPVA